MEVAAVAEDGDDLVHRVQPERVVLVRVRSGAGLRDDVLPDAGPAPLHQGLDGDPEVALSELEEGTLTMSSTPSNAAALFASAVSAPGCPSVTPFR